MRNCSHGVWEKPSIFRHIFGDFRQVSLVAEEFGVKKAQPLETKIPCACLLEQGKCGLNESKHNNDLQNDGIVCKSLTI